MYVVSPISDEISALTQGKKYKIIEKYENSPSRGGYIINDKKRKILIIFKGCAHICNKNWIIIGMKRELKGRDQYNKLNRKEKNRFKKLYIQAFGLNQWHQYLNQVCRCFSSFITNGFEWIGTPQGIDYWVKLSGKFE